MAMNLFQKIILREFQQAKKEFTETKADLTNISVQGIMNVEPQQFA